MVYSPHGNPQQLVTLQKTITDSAWGIRLKRETFLAQLADTLTTLNGWAYLAQLSSCRISQQRYLAAMQDSVRHITLLLQHHKEC